MKRGIVIGKFYPPHNGHSFLIESARAQVDELTVIICDKQGQKIPGDLRAEWLREIHPGIQTKVVEDILAEDDSQGWATYTIERLGFVPDVVFTSEAYGDSYARHLGCKHVLVDQTRDTVPVSASQIRKDPLAKWAFLHACVRAYFAKRACILGAESTGTTTMAKALAEHYHTAWVPEFGRTYWEGRMYLPSPVPWTVEEFVFIARQQNRLEDELARLCNRILICDTDSFTTSLWQERYMGFLSPKIACTHEHRKIDLYLLTDVDIPFVQDGTRDGEHIREHMHQRFLSELERLKKPFFVLSGSLEARLRVAIGLCDRELKAPSLLAED